MMEAAPQEPLVHERQGTVAGVWLILLAVAATSFIFFEARVALLVVAGAVFVGYGLVRVEVALFGLVAAAPIDDAFQIANSEFLTLSKLAGAVCFTSFALHALVNSRRLHFDRSHAVVLVLFLLALVSSVQARDVALGFSTALRYASYGLLYILVTQFVGEDRLLRRIVWVLSASATFAAGLALQRYLTEDIRTATLQFGDPNDLAFVLAATVPLTAWTLLRSGSVARLVGAGMIATMFAGIAFSLSRGALVGLGVGFLWVLLVERRHLQALVGLSLLGVLVAVAVVQSDPQRFEETLQAKMKVADQNVDFRLDAWAAAARLATEHPLGVGPGNFRSYYFEMTGRPVGSFELGAVHNAYLHIAAEVGWISVLLFVVFLALAFTRLNEAKHLGKGPPDLAVATRVSLVIAISAAVFLSQQYHMPIWLLCGLATAMWAEGDGSAHARG